MKKEDELIRKAVRKGMPDKETVLNHCILTLEKEEKECAMLKKKRFISKKVLVVACVLVGILAAATIGYAQTGEFPIRLYINEQEENVEDYLEEDHTIHIEDEENNATMEVEIESSEYQLDVNADGDEIVLEIRDSDTGGVTVEERNPGEE